MTRSWIVQLGRVVVSRFAWFLLVFACHPVQLEQRVNDQQAAIDALEDRISKVRCPLLFSGAIVCFYSSVVLVNCPLLVRVRAFSPMSRCCFRLACPLCVLLLPVCVLGFVARVTVRIESDCNSPSQMTEELDKLHTDYDTDVKVRFQ